MSGVHRLPLQHLRRDGQIVDPAVGAGADEDLVERRALHLAHRGHVGDLVGAGDLRREIGDVELDRVGVLGIDRIDRLVLFPGAAVEVGKGDLIRLDQPGFGAHLDRHVGQRHALADVHALHRLAAVFDRHRGGAVDVQAAGQRQANVLGIDAVLELAVQRDPQRLRDAEPGTARGIDHGDVGRAHARAETAERAIGAAMRIGADHQAARHHKASLHHHLMADALGEDVS